MYTYGEMQYTDEQYFADQVGADELVNDDYQHTFNDFGGVHSNSSYAAGMDDAPGFSIYDDYSGMGGGVNSGNLGSTMYDPSDPSSFSSNNISGAHIPGYHFVYDGNGFAENDENAYLNGSTDHHGSGFMNENTEYSNENAEYEDIDVHYEEFLDDHVL